MIIEIQGIKIIITQKRIKNYIIHVLPPDGQVTMSVPLSANEETMRRMIEKKIKWIKKHQKLIKEREPVSINKYISGEIYYIWGQPYILEVEFLESGSQTPRLQIIQTNSGDTSTPCDEVGKAILSISPNTSKEQRENYIYSQLSPLMKKELLRLISLWEAKTNLHCSKWYLKNLKTKWGVYHRRKNTISINIQLVNKPIECLEYIVVHELGHIKIHNHGKDFYAYMDKYLPNWKELRNTLCKTK